MNIYVLARMLEDPMLQKYQILDAVTRGDWFTSEIAALATMDQNNCETLENLTDEEYFSGNFHLMGSFKFEFKGVV